MTAIQQTCRRVEASHKNLPPVNLRRVENMLRMDLPDAENVARAEHAVLKRRADLTDLDERAAEELADEIYDGELDRCKDIDCDLASI